MRAFFSDTVRCSGDDGDEPWLSRQRMNNGANGAIAQQTMDDPPWPAPVIRRNDVAIEMLEQGRGPRICCCLRWGAARRIRADCARLARADFACCAPAARDWRSRGAMTASISMICGRCRAVWRRVAACAARPCNGCPPCWRPSDRPDLGRIVVEIDAGHRASAAPNPRGCGAAREIRRAPAARQSALEILRAAPQRRQSTIPGRVLLQHSIATSLRPDHGCWPRRAQSIVVCRYLRHWRLCSFAVGLAWFIAGHRRCIAPVVGEKSSHRTPSSPDSAVGEKPLRPGTILGSGHHGDQDRMQARSPCGRRQSARSSASASPEPLIRGNGADRADSTPTSRSVMIIGTRPARLHLAGASREISGAHIRATRHHPGRTCRKAGSITAPTFSTARPRDGTVARIVLAQCPQPGPHGTAMSAPTRLFNWLGATSLPAASASPGPPQPSDAGRSVPP